MPLMLPSSNTALVVALGNQVKSGNEVLASFNRVADLLCYPSLIRGRRNQRGAGPTAHPHYTETMHEWLLCFLCFAIVVEPDN